MLIKRKRKTKVPCLDCGLHLNLCICKLIPKLVLNTKVCLVVHHRELKRTTNTGMLAVKSLVNSEVRIRGEQNKPKLDLSDLLTSSYQTLLFFPTADAIELTKDFVKQIKLPIQLIVPDGNWRQASKIGSRHPEIKNILRVKLNIPNDSKKHLRSEHFCEGMATLQAIAYALEIIEGPAKIQPLFTLYQAKLKNTLIGRGKFHDD